MLNLFDILLETLDYDRLIEEGKDPVQLLHYKFQNKVPSDIIDSIIKIDPTKKKSDAMWTLSHWDNESNTIQNALDDGRLQKLFDFFKEHKEVQIKDVESVQKGLDAYVSENDNGEEEDTVLGKSSKPETYVLMLDEYVDSDLANDFDIIFNQDDWLIAVPNTYEAACKLGENCWWCTSNHFGNGKSYYEQYLQEGGKYYINFDLSQSETLDDKTEKTYPYTRYQFHFETKQFKAATEDEPDVSLDDLNIPQSAIDFYHEIDENYDIGEIDPEVKFERYMDQRNQDSIYITDDLYLNIVFDDEYEYHEPDDTDDWYVFDSQVSDEEPITYSEVDPHVDKSVVYKSDNEDILVIKGKYGNIFVVFYKNEYRYDSDDVYKYLPIGTYGLIGITNSEFYFYFDGQFYDEFQTTMKNLSDEVVDIEKNNNIHNGEDEFYEIIYKNGYHSLFSIENYISVSWVVIKDKPLDSNYFQISEDGYIHGEFKTYSLDDDGEEEKYGFDEQITDDLIIVVNKAKFNVYSKKKKGLLFTGWFDKIQYEKDINIFILKNDGRYTFADYDGNFIGSVVYNSFSILGGNEHKVLFGETYNNNGRIFDLIDPQTHKIFDRFRNIISVYKDKGLISVVTLPEDKRFPNSPKLYDYINRKFVFDTIFDLPLFYYMSKWFGSKEKDGTDVLKSLTDYNFAIKLDCPISSLTTETYLITSEGKQNVISPETILLPQWCDEVKGVIKTSRLGYVIIFNNNGKNYLYSTGSKQYLINPNGIPYNIYKDAYNRIHIQKGEGIQVLYDPNDNDFDIPAGYMGNPNKKQEAEAFIAELGGKQYNSNQQMAAANAAVAEEFKRFMKRINEAQKLNYKDIFD